MHITTEALTEFLRCPLAYKFRYVDGVPLSRKKSIYSVFEKAVKQMGYYIFHHVQNGTYPDNYKIKKAWGRLWCPNRTREQILFHMGSNHKKITYNPRHKEIQGLEIALNLGAYFKDNPGTPVMIGSAYDIEYGRHIISGIIDVAREVNGKLELILFKYSDKRVQDIYIKHDPEVTIASYAFRKLLGTRENNLSYHLVQSNKVIRATRENKDYNNLYKILDSVEIAIEEELFYPVLNEACLGCAFKNRCNGGNWFGS